MKHRLLSSSLCLLILVGCNQQTTTNTPDVAVEQAKLLTFTSQKISYPVPQTNEEIIVTATINSHNHTITSLGTQHIMHHPKSERYMQWFDDGIQDAVIGKPIDKAHVGIINGASDTSDGFNQALQDIRQQYYTYEK